MTLFSLSSQGKIINTRIAQINASKVVTECNDIRFVEWTKTNKHASFWYSEDIAKSEILQRSITKAIKKSCHHDTNLSYLISLQSTNDISLWDLYQHTPAITAFPVSAFTALRYSIVT
jgi:hypothetical protein